MRIVYCGSGGFGLASLKYLVESEHELVQIVTQPTRPAGRGRKLHPTSVAQFAREQGLRFIETDNINRPDYVEMVEACQPDVMLVIAFGQKIGTKLLNNPDFRVINLHSSLLPKYRGAAPINWAIINGEKETGLTIFELEEHWDSGAILGQLATPIRPLETAGELHDRLASLGPDLIARVLEEIALGTDTPTPQDNTKASKAPKLKKADGQINWELSAERIKNQILGMSPWPGAFCEVRLPGKDKSERLIICRAQAIHEEQREIESATILPGTMTQDNNIACGRGFLRPLEVIPFGSKIMDFKSYINGRRLQPGDHFKNGKL